MHRFPILAVQVRMAGSEEGEQSQCRSACIRIPPCPAPILPEDHLFLARAELIGVPASIGRLCFDKPVQRGNDGRFRFCVAALALDEAEPVRCIAKRVSVR